MVEKTGDLVLVPSFASVGAWLTLHLGEIQAFIVFVLTVVYLTHKIAHVRTAIKVLKEKKKSKRKKKALDVDNM